MSPDGINRRGNSAGFGDVTMLGQYRFHNNAQTGTSAAVLFGFKAPTGSTNRRDAAGHFPGRISAGFGLVGRPVRRRLHQTPRPLVVRRERPLLSDHHGHAGYQSRRPLSVRHRGVISPGRSHRLVKGDRAARILHAAEEPDAGALSLSCQSRPQRHEEDAVHARPRARTQWRVARQAAHRRHCGSQFGRHHRYLSPGVRMGVDRFSGFLSFGVPVINQHNGVQSKPDYRILTGIGARLN